jgi:hypothetical protein
MIPKRRWVRFSLFGSAVVGTLAACWVGYHLNWIRERNDAKVFKSVHSVAIRQPDGSAKFVTVHQKAPWPLGWFGEEGHRDLAVEDSTPKAEIEQILALFPEAKGEIELVERDEIHPPLRR